LRGDAAIAAHVCASERFDIASRLAVYAQGYAERLIEALAVTYPAVRRTLGEATFGRLIRALAHGSPSRSFSVRHYGRELAALIGLELPGIRGEGAAELAAWEWALAEAFDAADAVPLHAAELARIAPAAWGALVLRMIPSARTIELSSNAVRWWKYACAAGPRPHGWRRLHRRAWLVWRRELAVLFRPLAADESRALAALQRGETFERICAQLANGPGEGAQRRAPLRAAQLLRGWVGEGLLAGVSAA
jgi:hypothetical protein